METLPTRSFSSPYLYHDLVNDRIRTLHREAEHQRLVNRLRRLKRARRNVQRANDRLRTLILSM
jgi:hypothetical protein